MRSLPEDPAAYARVVRGVVDLGMVRGAGGGASSSVQVEDVPGLPKTWGAADPVLRDQLVGAVKHVFGLHGAVSMASSSLGCATADLPEDAATFLSSTGLAITLRYDCRYPFALWVSERGERRGERVFLWGGRGLCRRFDKWREVLLLLL